MTAHIFGLSGRNAGMATRVLVPVDRGDPASRAFDFAIENFADSNITVLYVISPPEARYLTGDETRFRPKFEEAVEEATGFLDAFVDRAEADGVDIQVDHTLSYESGQTARAIIDYADDHDIDHIIMGSHGKRGVQRLLLGSVAEKVLQRTKIPVTIYR